MRFSVSADQLPNTFFSVSTQFLIALKLSLELQIRLQVSPIVPPSASQNNQSRALGAAALLDTDYLLNI